MLARLAPLALSACATSWITTQATGTANIWDEHVREVAVPQPGLDERLDISVPLVEQYEQAPGSAAPKPVPFAIACSTDQHGRDVVYHAAFRYGSFWKKATAVWFLAEAASASLLLLAGDGTIDDQVYGTLLAADAAVTGALFFLPREEIYRRDERDATTHVRSDCPDGLALQIGGDTFAIDAAGHIGEVGDAAFGEWKLAPTGELAVSLAGQTALLRVAGPSARVATGTLSVAEGTLSLAP